MPIAIYTEFQIVQVLDDLDTLVVATVGSMPEAFDWMRDQSIEKSYIVRPIYTTRWY